MRCELCGANLPVESLFCYACGWRVQNSNGKNVAKKRKINKTQPKSKEHIDVGSVESFNDSKTVGTASCGLAMEETARVTDISSRFANGLENLNTARGGENGFYGFVGEEMQAAEASINGKMTYVINNNGSADLVYVGKNGHKYYQQVKLGYENSFKQKINFAEYKGQTIVVDKGNPSFAKIKAEGAKHGVKVIEGNITKAEAQELAKYMQQETAITGAKKAFIVPKVAAAHKAGLSSGKAGALYGAGFSMGSNLVDVACGDKELGEAAKDVVKDTAVSYAAGYAVGAAGSVVASTSAGAAVISGVGAAGAAVTSTAAGAAVVSGAAAAGAAVAGAGVAATGAVVGSVAAAGSAVGGAAVAATAGTAIGGAVAGGVAATAAAGAAVGAAAVAAAPVVAVGAAIGVGYKLLKKIF